MQHGTKRAATAHRKMGLGGKSLRDVCELCADFERDDWRRRRLEKTDAPIQLPRRQGTRPVKVLLPPLSKSPTARPCRWCGREHFNTRTVFCSVECRRERRKELDRRKMSRRRAQDQGGSEIIDLRAVGNRDGWRCHICKGAVDRRLKYPHRRAGSVDHLVPLARGGLHELRNVGLAHLECNWRKHVRPTGEQLRLVG